MSRHTLFLSFTVLIIAATLVYAQNVQMVSAPNTQAESGAQMFATYCATCHGAQGRGDGPASGAYKTTRTNISLLTKHNNGIFPKAYVNGVIAGKTELPSHNGANGMPKWRDVLIGVDFQRTPNVVERRIANLTEYVQQLQAN